MKVEIAPFSIKFDGVEQQHVVSADVRLRLNSVPEVDISYLAIDTIEVYGAAPMYVARAMGCYAQSDDPATTLRMLADAIDLSKRQDAAAKA